MHTSKAGAVVRRSGEGERRWFFGGGIWTWKLSGAEAQDGLLVVEVELDGGKRTPLHTHPIVESMWVLAGSLRFRVGDDDHVLDTGDYIWVPSETPHAFLVESEHARVLVRRSSGVRVSRWTARPSKQTSTCWQPVRWPTAE